MFKQKTIPIHFGTFFQGSNLIFGFKRTHFNRKNVVRWRYNNTMYVFLVTAKGVIKESSIILQYIYSQFSVPQSAQTMLSYGRMKCI